MGRNFNRRVDSRARGQVVAKYQMQMQNVNLYFNFGIQLGILVLRHIQTTHLDFMIHTPAHVILFIKPSKLQKYVFYHYKGMIGSKLIVSVAMFFEKVRERQNEN